MINDCPLRSQTTQGREQIVAVRGSATHMQTSTARDLNRSSPITRAQYGRYTCLGSV